MSNSSKINYFRGIFIITILNFYICLLSCIAETKSVGLPYEDIAKGVVFNLSINQSNNTLCLTVVNKGEQNVILSKLKLRNPVLSIMTGGFSQKSLPPRMRQISLNFDSKYFVKNFKIGSQEIFFVSDKTEIVLQPYDMLVIECDLTMVKSIIRESIGSLLDYKQDGIRVAVSLRNVMRQSDDNTEKYTVTLSSSIVELNPE